LLSADVTATKIYLAKQFDDSYKKCHVSFLLYLFFIKMNHISSQKEKKIFLVYFGHQKNDKWAKQHVTFRA
jgi:hypothetical protein